MVHGGVARRSPSERHRAPLLIEADAGKATLEMPVITSPGLNPHRTTSPAAGSGIDGGRMPGLYKKRNRCGRRWNRTTGSIDHTIPWSMVMSPPRIEVCSPRVVSASM